MAGRLGLSSAVLAFSAAGLDRADDGVAEEAALAAGDATFASAAGSAGKALKDALRAHRPDREWSGQLRELRDSVGRAGRRDGARPGPEVAITDCDGSADIVGLAVRGGRLTDRGEVQRRPP